MDKRLKWSEWRSWLKDVRIDAWHCSKKELCWEGAFVLIIILKGLLWPLPISLKIIVARWHQAAIDSLWALGIVLVVAVFWRLAISPVRIYAKQQREIRRLKSKQRKVKNDLLRVTKERDRLVVKNPTPDIHVDDLVPRIQKEMSAWANKSGDEIRAALTDGVTGGYLTLWVRKELKGPFMRIEGNAVSNYSLDLERFHGMYTVFSPKTPLADYFHEPHFCWVEVKAHFSASRNANERIRYEEDE